MATCVYATTCDEENEEDRTKEDVRPIACDGADDVLFLLGSRNGGVRFLRGGKKRFRGRASRVLATQTDLDKVCVRGGGVGQRKELNVGIASII
jgi:hypothetical protein